MPATFTQSDRRARRFIVNHRTVTLFLVFAAFFTTLLQYWLSLSNANLIPVALLLLAGVLCLIQNNRREVLPKLLAGGATLILFSMLSEVVSLYSGSSYSIQYGLLFILLFFSARLIILQLGFLAIVRCYIYSGLCSVVVILIGGHKQLAQYSAGGSRFSGGVGVHPNLLGFSLASYFFLFVALALDLKSGLRRFVMALAILLTLVLLFTTGSRGSLAAVLFALILMTLRFSVLNPVLRHIRLSLYQVIFALGATLFTVYYVTRGNRIAQAGKFIVKALALNDEQRGLHSGFSGRTKFWELALHELSGLQWIFGFGFRSANVVIDNGYLTVLFENGLALGIVILLCLLRIGYWLWKDTSVPTLSGWWRYRVALLSLLIVFLLNNFVARYLFSFGNQFSLLVVFMMLCRKQELLGPGPGVPVPAAFRPGAGNAARPARSTGSRLAES